MNITTNGIMNILMLSGNTKLTIGSARRRRHKKTMTEIDELLESDKASDRAARISEALNSVEIPPTETRRDVLLAGIRQYARDKSDRLSAARDHVQKVQAAIDKDSEALNSAAAAGDYDKAEKMAARKADDEKRLEYARDIVNTVEHSHVFPNDTVFSDEWAALTSQMRPEWDSAVQRVQMLAAEYNDAAADLLELYDLAKSCKNEVNRAARQDGYDIHLPTMLTPGLDPRSLIPRKTGLGCLGDRATGNEI